MKNILLMIVAVFGVSSFSFGQENGNKIIDRFLTEIYKSKKNTQNIVFKFVKHEDSLSLKAAALALMDMRRPRDSDETGHFSILKKDIITGNFSIDNFISFNSADKSQFNNLSEEDKKCVYRVLPKNTIPVYVLVKENKIVSFFGFRKAGSDSYTFIVF